MSSETIGILGFIVLFILMAIGLPIGVCMGIVGFVGMLFILPVQAAIVKMAITPYDLVSSYTFATLPLFILMGTCPPFYGTGRNALQGRQKMVRKDPWRSRYGNDRGMRRFRCRLCLCNCHGSDHGPCCPAGDEEEQL